MDPVAALVFGAFGATAALALGRWRLRRNAGRWVAGHDEDRPLLDMLRQALARRELTLHCQPQVGLSTGQVVGGEVLLRWQRAGGQTLAPAEFMAKAQQSDLIFPITEFVIDHALRLCAECQPRVPGFAVHINVSHRNLLDDFFFPYLDRKIVQYGLRRGQVVLELVQASSIRDILHDRTTLQRLLSIGFAVSTDDLLYLTDNWEEPEHWPFDRVKLTGSRVLAIATDPVQRGLVRRAVTTAQSLGMEIVAEGIENEAILELLIEMGVGFGQGYLFSRPLDPKALHAWIAQRASRPEDRTDAHTASDEQKKAEDALGVDDLRLQLNAQRRLVDAYRRRIAELERQLSAAEAPADPADPADMADTRGRGEDAGDQRRFHAVKRAFARLYHPNNAGTAANEVVRRGEVFKEFWQELQRIERL